MAWRVRDQLSSVPEASEVHLLGEQQETIRIEVSSGRMAEQFVARTGLLKPHT